MTAEPISVLFVDDDEQWAEYMADELVAEEPLFSVTVVGNVNEAVIALDDDHSVDCIVADFRMPDVDGIELLEHVQNTHPQLPFILVTGDGSEDVAARAITAGVTDYIRKDPLVDQAPIFVTRIRQAVERARLQLEIRASEHRYRTVIEQTRDGIVIVQDGAVVFANDRFDELCDPSVDTESRRSDSSHTGSTPTESTRSDSSHTESLHTDGSHTESSGQLFDCVHDDDHQQVVDLIRETRSGGDPGLRAVRLVRPTGEVRHCELLGDAISYDNEFATLLSIRDVTRRRSRERRLTREREFNQDVQQRLLGVRSRAELESEITELLSADGYGLVWIGTVDDRGLHTRATAGDAAYISRLEADTPDRDHGGDPILWTARTDEAQFVPDFERLMPTERRIAALECGFRTGYALPLCHDDIAYGILGVYHTDPQRIDEAERSLLAEVADTVSFALHHVETQQSLTSTEGVVVEVDIDSEAYYLPRLLADRFDHSAIEITVTGTQLIDGEGCVQYLSSSTDDPEAVAATLADCQSVRRCRVIDSGDPAIYQVTVDEETPETQLGAVGALVRSTTVTPDRTTVTFELSSREYLQAAVDRLNEQFGPVSVRSIIERSTDGTRERQARVDIDLLTDKQLVALEAAYQQGYFARPRRQSATEIAESLDITHTTYLQHLRVAERKVFGQLFGGLNDATNSHKR